MAPWSNGSNGSRYVSEHQTAGTILILVGMYPSELLLTQAILHVPYTTEYFQRMIIGLPLLD
jgi:hypothetical protein